MSYPAPDSKVYVTVTRWDGKCLIAIDANCNQYIHWLDDDKRWESSWERFIGTENLVLLARVGRADGPRGRKMFVVDVPVPVQKTEPVTRSPLDIFTAKGLDTTPLTQAEIQLDETLDAIKHRHRPEPLAGDTSSINIRLEGELAAWVRQKTRIRNCTARAVVSRAVAGAMAYDATEDAN